MPRTLNVQTQRAQRLFSTIFWLYWPILKQNGQNPWDELVPKHREKIPLNSKWPLWRHATDTTFDVQSQITTFVQHHRLTVLTDFEAELTNSLEEFVHKQWRKKTEPTLMARHGHALWRRVAKCTFVQHHLLTVLTNLEAEGTKIPGVSSQTTEKNTTEFKMAKFDGTSLPRPLT